MPITNPKKNKLKNIWLKEISIVDVPAVSLNGKQRTNIFLYKRYVPEPFSMPLIQVLDLLTEDYSDADADTQRSVMALKSFLTAPMDFLGFPIGHKMRGEGGLAFLLSAFAPVG